MTDTFETFVAKERERLNKERQDLLRQQQDISNKISKIDDELYAVDAYATAKKSGRGGTTSTKTKTGGTGSRRSGVRDQVLDVVKSSIDGISASGVIQTLQATEDSAKTSVRNALSALKRTGKIMLDGRTYKAA